MIGLLEQMSSGARRGGHEVTLQGRGPKQRDYRLPWPKAWVCSASLKDNGEACVAGAELWRQEGEDRITQLGRVRQKSIGPEQLGICWIFKDEPFGCW